MFLKTLLSLFKSSSFRFALFTGFTIWFATSGVLILVYFKLENTIWRSIDNDLDAQASAILAHAAEQPDIDINELVTAYNVMSRSSSTIIETSSSGMMAMHNTPAMQALHNAMGVASPPSHMLGDSQSLTTREGSLQFTREIELPNGQLITISQNIEYLNQLQNSLWQSLLFGLSITLFIAVLGALILTQRSLQRIHEINRACQTIANGNLNYRIPYKNSENKFDDYDQMASVINQMLDEINLLLSKVKLVSDNIAHDLKSPLARLRVQLELANQESQSTHVADGISEVDRLLAMIKSLLGITRIESHNKDSFKPTSLKTLLTDLTDTYQLSFEEAHLSLRSSIDDAIVMADKHLLFQAFANLLENALKFTPVRGKVAVVGTLIADNRYQISIQDSGPGISEDDLPKVFDRFYRGDKARNSSGFGLGLSLVKAIVTLHQGEVYLSNKNGLQVTVTLPVVP